MMTSPSPTHSDSSDSSKQDCNQDSWEIVEGLKGGPAMMEQPEPQQGFLLKRRKWPMKGWHKRYFVLEKGILKYAKRATDLRKGKVHGCIDVGLSVMTIKKSSMCIDLDTEDNIYHLKMKSFDVFEEWVTKLRHHRVFRQNEISSYPHPHYYHSHKFSSPSLGDSIRKGASLRKQTSSHQAKINSWLQSSEDMNKCAKDLEECESNLQELNLVLRSMEVMHRTYSASSINMLQTSTNDISKKEKRSKKWRSKNGKNSKVTTQMPQNHSLNPNLPYVEANNQETFPDSPDSPVEVSRLQENFNRLANNIHTSLKSAYSSLSAERERLKHTMELQPPQPMQVTALKSAYNSECLDEDHSLVHQSSNDSRASIPESVCEFYDAQEYLLSSSSSENELSDDDSYISDVSDSVSVETFSNEGASQRHSSVSSVGSVVQRRRKTLPSPSPPSSVSLWNILRNNIGKDLSKVAMPVQLNEPLNTLQRLCEELEYSELLDKANKTSNPYQRMVYVATFAITAYTSSYYRAASKPFNPVLGETYECDRPDKGFKFIGEQVSHHPPVSVCHADSNNFAFWQDVRLRNKFWGKSMEIVPVGTTNVTLPSFGDHYEWNKVTSCIHNIISGQRWIEHYGEMTIKNVNNNTCECKITFVKARSWSSSVNEIEGVVTNSSGQVVHSMFGKWHESIFQGDPPSATCIWRANAMPPDHDQYYGFTKFAIELNELDPTTRPLLPPTDTRFRLDQRCLEEGNVEEAEGQKQRIEQLQRERRKMLEDNNMTHQPRFFKKSEYDTWVNNNSYWELRRDPGFAKVDFPELW
ncbi:oxysterol-binding protein-related protein 3-like isoform X2 [Stigmatopora nigra]